MAKNAQVASETAWFEGPLGRRLLALEERQLALMLPTNLSGYLLQLPCPFGRVGLTDIPYRLTVIRSDKLVVAGQTGVQVPASPAALPYADDSIAAVVLPHTLESGAASTQVIAETVRVLEPNGCLLMSGYNPWSLFGLIRLKSRLRWDERRTGPGAAHFQSLWRVRRQLHDCDLEIEQITTVFHRLPIDSLWAFRSDSVMDRLGPRLLPQGGGIYFVLARKRGYGVTPLIVPRHRRMRRGGLALVGTARSDLS